jgi:hypothetical protein
MEKILGEAEKKKHARDDAAEDEETENGLKSNKLV